MWGSYANVWKQNDPTLQLLDAAAKQYGITVDDWTPYALPVYNAVGGWKVGANDAYKANLILREAALGTVGGTAHPELAKVSNAVAPDPTGANGFYDVNGPVYQAGLAAGNSKENALRQQEASSKGVLGSFLSDLPDMALAAGTIYGIGTGLAGLMGPAGVGSSALGGSSAADAFATGELLGTNGPIASGVSLPSGIGGSVGTGASVLSGSSAADALATSELLGTAGPIASGVSVPAGNSMLGGIVDTIKNIPSGIGSAVNSVFGGTPNASNQPSGLGGIANALGVASPLIGSILGSNASSDAADAQIAAANAASANTMAMYNQNRADLSPWRVAGVNALNQLSAGTQPGGQFVRPFGMSDYQADPGYGFRLSEGIKALDRSAASRGNLLSGGALKGITRYGQDMASQEYGNAYARYNQDQGNAFNRINSMSSTGANAAGQIAGLGASAAGQVGNNIMGAGNAQAAGMVGGANALSAGLAGAYNNYQGNQMVNALRQSGYGEGGFRGAYNNDLAQFGNPYGG
jgi:hypothetical protein